MSKRKTIINLLEDDQLLSYVYQANKSDNLKKAVSSRKKSLNKNKLYVAVFGVQGAGKSSFLNALVAGGDILPVEADETTCIPVELHKSLDGKEKGIIFYDNGKQDRIEVDRAKIDKYVNNVHNPENELGVDHIELYINSSFLREDIVFVDLPGVASLREGNQETTLQYIDRCTAAVFIIRTLPTIGRFESTLMRLVWPQVSQSFFVQNFWSGESRRELENGREHNKKILKDISFDININEEIEIIPVQVKDATKAVFTGNQKLKQDSNLDLIEEKLQDGFDNWQEEITLSTASWLKSVLGETRKYFKSISSDLEKDTDQAIKDLEKKQREFKEKRKDIKEKFADLRYKAHSFEDDIKKEMKKFIKKTRKEMLSNTEKKIEKGIFDGEYLEKIIEDAVNDSQSRVAVELEFKLEDMTEYIMEDFKDILKETVDIREDMVDDLDVESVEDKFKGEKALSAIGGIGGGLGGAALVGFIVSNPAGWVVGAGMLVGGLIGGLLGQKGKEKVEEERIKKAKKPARKSINKAFRKIKKNIKKEIDKYRHNIIDKLDQTLEDELNNIEEEYKSRLEIIRDNKEDKKEKLEKINNKISKINKAIDRL